MTTVFERAGAHTRALVVLLPSLALGACESERAAVVELRDSSLPTALESGVRDGAKDDSTGSSDGAFGTGDAMYLARDGGQPDDAPSSLANDGDATHADPGDALSTDAPLADASTFAALRDAAPSSDSSLLGYGPATWKLSTEAACETPLTKVACSTDAQGSFAIHAESTCVDVPTAQLWFPPGQLTPGSYEILPVINSSAAHDVPAGRVIIVLQSGLIDHMGNAAPPRLWIAQSGTLTVVDDGAYLITARGVEVAESTSDAAATTLDGYWVCGR